MPNTTISSNMDGRGRHERKKSKPQDNTLCAACHSNALRIKIKENKDEKEKKQNDQSHHNGCHKGHKAWWTGGGQGTVRAGLPLLRQTA